MKLIGGLKTKNSFYELYQKDAEFFKVLKWFEQSKIEEKKEELISKSEIQSILTNPSGIICYYIGKNEEYKNTNAFTCSYFNKEKNNIEITIYGYGDTPEEALDSAEKSIYKLMN